MFKSKIRSIIIPQYEHERLAGTFASMWGNSNFDRPPLDFEAFVQGVALHDYHYGFADTLAIGGGNEADWIKLVRKGVGLRFDDPSTDIVAKLHIRRLLSSQKSLERAALIDQVDSHIAKRLPETGLTRDQFEWTDRITRFCDRLAFDFSFETPVKDNAVVYARIGSTEETEISYAIEAEGEIRLDPWPFCTDSFAGIILGYQEAGYPEELAPVVVRFWGDRNNLP